MCLEHLSKQILITLTPTEAVACRYAIFLLPLTIVNWSHKPGPQSPAINKKRPLDVLCFWHESRVIDNYTVIQKRYFYTCADNFGRY